MALNHNFWTKPGDGWRDALAAEAARAVMEPVRPIRKHRSVALRAKHRLAKQRWSSSRSK